MLGFRDQRAEDMMIIDEAGLHRREKEKERHIETGTTKATDRPFMKAEAAVETGAVIEAEAEAEAAAIGGIDHRTTEARLVGK